MQALVAGTLRLDKKCGKSGIAPGDKCRKGVGMAAKGGSQWVVMTPPSKKPIEKQSTKELNRRLSEIHNYHIEKAKITTTKVTLKDIERLMKVEENSPMRKEQEEIYKTLERRHNRTNRIINAATYGYIAAVVGIAGAALLTSMGESN